MNLVRRGLRRHFPDGTGLILDGHPYCRRYDFLDEFRGLFVGGLQCGLLDGLLYVLAFEAVFERLVDIRIHTFDLGVCLCFTLRLHRFFHGVDIVIKKDARECKQHGQRNRDDLRRIEKELAIGVGLIPLCLTIRFGFVS